MDRDQQAEAIWERALCSFDMINQQFRNSMRNVLSLAALAFDEEAGLDPASLHALESYSDFMWAHMKGQLERAVRDSGIDTPAQAEWKAALQAVYRIAGSDHIEPKYGGAL